MNDEIKKLKDQIQALLVEKAQLSRPCPHTGQAAYVGRQLRLQEIQAELQELNIRLQMAQSGAVAGAIGKGDR